MVNQQKCKDSFSFSFSHILMCLNSGALVRWWQKIKYPFKLNLAAIYQQQSPIQMWQMNKPHPRMQKHWPAPLQWWSGCTQALGILLSTRNPIEHTHTHYSISLFGINYKFTQARLCQPPSKRTSIFLTRASVSYHIWMEPGSWRVRVIRSTMQ